MTLVYTLIHQYNNLLPFDIFQSKTVQLQCQCRFPIWYLILSNDSFQFNDKEECGKADDVATRDKDSKIAEIFDFANKFMAEELTPY